MKLKQSEKKEIISRLVNIPEKNKRFFWAREIKFLNDLYEGFPNVDFWILLNFNKKYDSLVFLKGQYGAIELKKRYLEFSYKPSVSEKIILGEKSGKNYNKPKKIKTIKDFLTNE